MNSDKFAHEVENDRLTRMRWRVRRRITITSFIIICIVTIFILVSPFIMSSDQAQILSEFNSILVTLIGFNSSVVMFYIGASTYDDNQK